MQRSYKVQVVQLGKRFHPLGEAGEASGKSKSSELVELSKPARVSGRDHRLPVRFQDYPMY